MEDYELILKLLEGMVATLDRTIEKLDRFLSQPPPDHDFYTRHLTLFNQVRTKYGHPPQTLH